MNLNTETLQRVCGDALAAAEKMPRWQNAIKKAEQQLLENPLISEVDGLLLIASESGQIYNVGTTCECQAYQNGKPCWHRAAWRLVQRYNQANAKGNYERQAELRAQRILAALVPPTPTPTPAPSMAAPKPAAKVLATARIVPTSAASIDDLF